MVDVRIKLNDFDTIKFDPSNLGWVGMYINDTYIGSDSIAILKERIGEKLLNRDSLESKCQLDDQDLCWLISFMETWNVLYVSRSSPPFLFLLEEGDPNRYTKYRINDEFIEKVNKILASFVES